MPPNQSRSAPLGRALPAGYRVLLPRTASGLPPGPALSGSALTGSALYADAFRREEP